MNKAITLSCLLGLGVYWDCLAGDFSPNAVGTTGSEILALDLGARGIGMGGAFSAVSDDASSLYWNPAGLAQIPNMSATVMHNSYIADISFDYAAYAQRVSKSSVIGGALRYLDAGSITGTDINGNTQASFHPRSYVYELGIGQTVSDLFDVRQNVTMGLTGRIFSSTIDRTAVGFAADIGAQYHYDRARYPHTLSLVVQNLGQGEKYDADRSKLPMKIRFGGALNATDSLLLASDLIFPISNQPDLALGAEYGMAGYQDVKLSVRTGLDSQLLLNAIDGFHGMNFGFGVSAMNVAFDYAFAPMGVLGNTHRISLSINLPFNPFQRRRER